MLCCTLPPRYLLRVTMTGKGMVSDTKKDAPFWVRNYDTPPDEAPPIKMEVRVEAAAAWGWAVHNGGCI